MLSQSCAPLRAILHQHGCLECGRGHDDEEWNLREFRQAIYGLSKDRLDRWACRPCVAMHTLSPRRDLYQESHICPRRAHSTHDQKSLLFHKSQVSEPELIQIALKFERLADRLNLEEMQFLEELMKPYFSAKARPLSTSRPGQPYRVTVPRIVHGRFMVYSEISFHKDDGFRYASLLYQETRPLCNHRNALKQFSPCVEKEPIPPGWLYSEFACMSCSAEICAIDVGTCSVLRIWEDLGPEVSFRERDRMGKRPMGRWEEICRSPCSTRHHFEANVAACTEFYGLSVPANSLETAGPASDWTQGIGLLCEKALQGNKQDEKNTRKEEKKSGKKITLSKVQLGFLKQSSASFKDGSRG